ncbi:MAG: hypothetical protein ABF649_18355 [Bacillus sp. (in: firmicutes)]
MNWKLFLAGIGVGAVTAFMATDTAAKNHALSSDHVLNIVKKQFKKQGSITGSWINMQKEKFEYENAIYYIYKGGITTEKQEKKELVEFIADSKTGKILDSNLINI